jgi:phosphate transport system permease protein
MHKIGNPELYLPYISTKPIDIEKLSGVNTIQGRRILKDKLGRKLMFFFTILTIIVLFAIGIGLIIKSLPILSASSISDLFFSSIWAPNAGRFGFLPFIISTLWVTAIAMAIAIPLCLLCAIYLSEYADKKIIRWVNPLMDILAGIPSVIFGIWGVILIVPFVKNYVGPMMNIETTGYTILTGGIVLSVMIFPVMIHILLEVFNTISPNLRNASLSLGATKWQTVKLVVLKKAMPGIISAIVLSLSRAFGETLAVLMVVGNVIAIPTSSLDSGYPLTALIANNYGEMMSIPMYDSALMLSALVLFVIVFIFNIIARVILRRVERKID